MIAGSIVEILLKYSPENVSVKTLFIYLFIYLFILLLGCFKIFVYLFHSFLQNS